MATLTDLYGMLDSELRNQIVAACWNKAKTILTDGAATAPQITYARDVLLTKNPVEKIVIGTLAVIQDNATPADNDIQTAVDAVVDKLITVEV